MKERSGCRKCGVHPCICFELQKVKHNPPEHSISSAEEMLRKELTIFFPLAMESEKP